MIVDYGELGGFARIVSINVRFKALIIGILQLCTAVLAAQSYEKLFGEAAGLSANGDYQKAIRKYEAALRIRPDAPEALSNLGVMYNALGRYSEAVDVAQRALKLQPELLPANLIVGLALIQLNRAADSIAPLERVLARDPKQRDAILGLASARVALQDLPAAVILYRRATGNNPRDHEAWYGLAVCYERMAEAASRRLAHMEGGAEYHKRLLGEYLLRRGEDRLALEALDDAAVISRTDLKPVPEAAALYSEARNLAELSREAFLTFSELAPQSWQSHLFLGDLYRQQRKFPEAIQSYHAAAKLEPRNPAPLLGMGTVYWELGDDQRAESCLQRVLALNAKNSQALYELGSIALRQRRDAEAVKYLEIYLTIQPDQFMARADLGKAYLHLKRFPEAAEQLEKALAVDRFGDIHFQLATALRALKREPEAAFALEESKRIRDSELQREQKLRVNR